MLREGLWPQTPQKLLGVRIDPARSAPSSRNPNPAASAAAPPPVEPPDVLVTSQGLLVVPATLLYVWMSLAPMGVLVFPTIIAPARRSFSTVTAFSLGR